MSSDDDAPKWSSPELALPRDVILASAIFAAFLVAGVIVPILLPTLSMTGLPDGLLPLGLGSMAGIATASVVRAAARDRTLGALPPLSLLGLAGSIIVLADPSIFVGHFAASLAAAAGLLHAVQWYVPIRHGIRVPERWRLAVCQFDAAFGFWLLLQVVAVVVAIVAFGRNSQLLPVESVLIVGRILALAWSILAFVWCIAKFYRAAFELVLEQVARFFYRIRSTGPGANDSPVIGPLLVVANHACWPDPLFIGKVLPRPIKPIMTQRFYEIWFLKPLLKYVFRVIVVPEAPLRREAPELQQAIAALDRGECVVIFPEGYLRRKDDVPLRRFGQGVWHILSARPGTPVQACWIEGGWGSKFSYRDGPPGSKKKPMDWARRIDVAMGRAEVVPPEVLADQLGTRIALMNRVLEARSILDVQPLQPFELPSHRDGAETEKDE